MPTPTKLPPDGHSPIKYDIENTGASRFDAKFLSSIAKTGESGDTDIN